MNAYLKNFKKLKLHIKQSAAIIEKILKYEKARQRYEKAHPDYIQDIWRGPQDDEFEADIMKYYEE